MPVMPDARVPLGALGGEGGGRSGGPLQTLGALMQIKEKQQEFRQREKEAQLKQRELEDDDAIRSALQQYDRPEDAVVHLFKDGRSTAGAKVAQDIYHERTARLQADDAQLKNNATRMEQIGQILHTVKDNATLQLARPNLVKLGEPMVGQTVNDLIPTEYGDGTQVKTLLDMTTSRALQIQQEQLRKQNLMKAHELGFTSTKDMAAAMNDPDFKLSEGAMPWSQQAMQSQAIYQEDLARQLSIAPNKTVYDNTIKQAYSDGYPEPVIKKFPPWHPDANERSRLLGLTMQQRTNAENAEARIAQAERARDLAEAREARIAAGGGPQSRPTTPAHLEVVEDKRKTDDKETEKWAQDAWERDNPTGTREKDAKGKTIPKYFDYNTLSDASKKEYVKQRLETENTYRARHDKLPSIREAAIAAARRGDAAGLAKLREVVRKVTNNLATLEDIVK